MESHYRVEGTLPCGGGIYVWELFTCGGDITVQLPYTVINMWRGTLLCGEPLPCGGGITVWRGHLRVGAIHMWRGHYRAATVHSN